MDEKKLGIFLFFLSLNLAIRKRIEVLLNVPTQVSLLHKDNWFPGRDSIIPILFYCFMVGTISTT